VLNIQRDASGLRVQPDGVLINMPIPQAPQVRVTSGQITVLANQVTLSALTISAAGGDVRLSGNYSWADVAGEIEATWQGITLPQGIVNAGSAKASIKTPLPNRPEISAELHSRGKTRAGHWNAEVNLSGKGSSWQNIDWTLDAPLLEFSAIKHQFELHSLGAHLITADNKLRLVEITHPGAGVVHGTGELDFATHNWALDVSAGGVQVPNAPPAPIDLAIQASGESLGSVKVKEARFRQQDLVLAASGFYDAKLPKPVNLTIHVSQQPTIAEEASNPLMKGTLESQSTAAGTLDPLDIGLTGQLRAEGLTIRDRPVGNATLQFNGELNRDGALFRTTDLQALGGWWKLTGTWAGEDEPVKLHISAHDVSVGDVAEVIKKNRIAGTLAGDWDLTTSSLRPSQMKLSGGATIVSPSVGVLSAEKLEAAVSMEDGIVHLDSIEAHKSNGKITASASFPLLHPTQWHFEGKMTNWPNALPRKGSSMSISAQTEFDADFAQRAVVGTLDSSETLVLNDAPAGTVLLSARSQGNTIELHNISADLIGGTLTGSGAVQLDNLLQSQVLLHVENIEAQRVAEIWPQVSDLSGKYNALFTLAPTTDPRALGPLRLSLTVYSQNARFRTISVGNIDVVAFADRQDGRSRLVIDDSVLNLADGQVRVWGRRSQHAGPTTNEAGPVSTQVELRFSNLNLNQIIHAFKPNEKPTPGRVAGSFVLTGKLNEFAKLFGTGNIRLSDSDIGNVEPFTTIYNFLNLRFGQHAPEGRGYAELRLDGDQLEISNAHYRIGGAEVRMSGTIQQLTKAPDSPIHGRAIASVQPFSDWKIPFIKEAGAFFATIQSGTVGAFRISGTLANRRTTPAAFSDAANIFRELLGMQTTEEP
jgi:hypothetical protein